MMKPRPGARSDSTPKNAAAAVDSAIAKIGAVTERDHAAVAEHHVDGEREQRVDEHLARHVDVELVADDPRHGEEDQRANGERNGAATRHICTRPNRPCGRNTSTSTIGKKRTK